MSPACRRPECCPVPGARFVDDHHGKGIPPKLVEASPRLAEFWGNQMVAVDEGLVMAHKLSS